MDPEPDHAAELALALQAAFDLYPEKFGSRPGRAAPAWSGLARVLDVDPSQVSRYRKGLFRPRGYRSELIKVLADYARDRNELTAALKGEALASVDRIRENVP